MRRLLRILVNAATVLSLLIFLAAAVLWVRGVWYYDEMTNTEKGSVCQVLLGAGDLRLQRVQDSLTYKARFTRFSYRRNPGARDAAYDFSRPLTTYVTDHEWKLPGISFHSEHIMLNVVPTIYLSEFTLSYWLIVLLTLILAASRIRVRKRPSPGHCPNCHYDLRATPDRCPECGTIRAKGAS